MALSQAGVRRWYLVHKWTSIVSTAFLLVLGITGLPLIFYDEIDELIHPPILLDKAAGTASLDAVAADALKEHPGWFNTFLSYDPEQPILYAGIGPTPRADEDATLYLVYDARTGTRLEAPPLDEGVMAFLLDLHANLLLGQAGQLFLGCVGLVFLAAIVSGVVVYAPFMRKLAFGTVRKNRSRRVKWLDLHNMVGIVTLGWVSVVALTGFINTMRTPITMLWQMDELADMAAPYRDAPPPARLASLDAAVATVRAAVPDGIVTFISWPGTEYSTRHHYMIALSGNTPLTALLVTPAMVDAETGRLTDLRPMPWYAQALFLSVPLHFGDYGGLPLKIVWALLDLALIVVLASGLYLWLARRRVPIEKRIEELRSGGTMEPLE
jgi:uncharacterized iron-regulated membrane protein